LRLERKRGKECNHVADDPQNEALFADLEKFLAPNFLVLVGLMASATPEMWSLYRAGMAELQELTAKAVEEVKTLPTEQQLQWWLAHMERMNERMAKLIRDLRAKS
jgi:hypothetical protein